MKIYFFKPRTEQGYAANDISIGKVPSGKFHVGVTLFGYALSLFVGR